MKKRNKIKAQLKRLADAMIKGAKKRKQAFGGLFSIKGNAEKGYKLGESCALGAVYETLFGPPPVRDNGQGPEADGGIHEMNDKLCHKLPILDTLVVEYPNSRVYDDDLMSVIVHLNDSQKWPRGRIARWIRRLITKQ